MTRGEELIRIAKKLDKMVSRNNTDGALDVLKELKSFNMTLKLLQDTRIGMSVNGIRKNCTNEEVVALAKLLIKNWKRLLDSARSQNNEKVDELKNGTESSRPLDSPVHISTETGGRRPVMESKPEKEPLKKHSGKQRKEKRCTKHNEGTGEWDEKKERQLDDTKKQTCIDDIKKERLDDPKRERDKEDGKKQSHLHEARKDRRVDEHRKEKQTMDHRQEWERRSVLDPSVLFPSVHSPPRRPSTEAKKERRESSDVSFLPVSFHRDPAPRRPSLQIKKERKRDPEPAPALPSVPLCLPPPLPPKHPPTVEVKRKEPPDPNAPLAPFPFHLHPPPPPPAAKRPSVDMKKDRNETADTKPVCLKRTSEQPKKDSKHSPDDRPAKRLSVEAKQDRKDLTDSKPRLLKRTSLDAKKERKDSSDSRPGHHVKRHSIDSKLERRDSGDSQPGSSPPAKKLTAERRESQGSKLSQPMQRKTSTDSAERRVKPETPKSPTTPTSPMSPSFSSPGGPLPPHLTTGESVRDKCIEMLAAALRTDDDYKVFGTNCESMAAELEDHIYQEIRATDMKYKNRVRSRISNLKDPKNPNLRKTVLAGGIELRRFAGMTAEEMASDELKQLRNVLTQEAIREHQMSKTGGTTTDLLQCGKCRKKNCTYNQVQTRSADEPMTTFVLCNECGNRWKFC